MEYGTTATCIYTKNETSSIDPPSSVIRHPPPLQKLSLLKLMSTWYSRPFLKCYKFKVVEDRKIHVVCMVFGPPPTPTKKKDMKNEFISYNQNTDTWYCTWYCTCWYCYLVSSYRISKQSYYACKKSEKDIRRN